MHSVMLCVLFGAPVMETLIMDTVKQQQHDDNLRCPACDELLSPMASSCPRCGFLVASTGQESPAAVFGEGEHTPQERILVFFSYARRDQTLRDQLENHLSNLKYRGLITTWHAREISAGEEAIHEIDIHEGVS